MPSVDELLRLPDITELAAREGIAPVTEAARTMLDHLRAEIAAGGLDEAGVKLAISAIPAAVERELQRTFAPSLRTVINATGVVLHTNLGRAPLSHNAIARIAETAGTYSNLEFDVGSGARGKRDIHVQKLFSRLLNLENASAREVDTVVVNNCAAAVMLALNTLAEGGEVIVSRGELVEIGGSFRVPDVMAKSNAILREVGTTNRTRIADYERAITDKTRLLLRVHRSNFAIVGFTEQPSVEELVLLGRKHRIPPARTVRRNREQRRSRSKLSISWVPLFVFDRHHAVVGLRLVAADHAAAAVRRPRENHRELPRLAERHLVPDVLVLAARVHLVARLAGAPLLLVHSPFTISLSYSVKPRRSPAFTGFRRM